MAKAYTTTRQTTEGKYFGQVRRFNGKADVILFESPEYLTEKMAQADAECWKVFHVTEEAKGEQEYKEVAGTRITEFSIDEDDKVYGRSGLCKTGREFAEILSGIIKRNPKVRFEVYPFTQSTKKGFHLDIVWPGNAPTMKFTVHKGA